MLFAYGPSSDGLCHCYIYKGLYNKRRPNNLAIFPANLKKSIIYKFRIELFTLSTYTIFCF